MKYEFCPKDKNIIQFGEYGDKFYMVIKGKVDVRIPKKFRESSLL